MNKGLFLLLMAVVSGSKCKAQIVSDLSKSWTSNQVDFGIGIDNDHFYNMSLDRLTSFAQNPSQMQRDLQFMKEEISPSTAGIALYINKSFSPWSKTQQKYREDRSLRLGVGMHAPKEAMIIYRSEALDTSIVYCNLHGEFTFEGAFLFNGSWGKKSKWKWYWGMGMNTSLSFSNVMLLIEGQYFEEGAHPSAQPRSESSITRYQAKPVAYLRGYIPYGLHYQSSEHWSLGFDLKRGIGVQTIIGVGSIFLPRTGTFVLGAKYKW